MKRRKLRPGRVSVYSGVALGIKPSEIIGEYVLFYCTYGRHKGVVVNEDKLAKCLRNNCRHLEKYVLQGKSE